jgi:mono/diheme cytochrome c family protein
MLLANVQTTFGAVILLLAVVIGVVYAAVNIRQSKAEVGSEIELAANRKPYFSDEQLEGRKLDRTLTLGLLGLFICGIGLPLYWLNEPGRQSGAQNDFKRVFAQRGAAMFAPTEKGGFNCAFCHGEKGIGGVADYTITDADGRFVQQVQWRAPALNTVLQRFNRDEVRYILTYGRPFSPMAPWGLDGGGPLNQQQIQNLIDYLQSIQITPKDSQAAVKTELAKAMQAPDQACEAKAVAAAKAKLTAKQLESFDATTVDTKSCPRQWKSEGEALFNLGYYDGFAGGAYSCGRCHTQGWSYGQKQKDGNGAYGPALTSVKDQFPGASLGLRQQTDFVCVGSEIGKVYGVHGQGTGRMPGFCVTPQEKGDNPVTGDVGVAKKDAGTPQQGAMLTEAQVRAVVEYERSLGQ